MSLEEAGRFCILAATLCGNKVSSKQAVESAGQTLSLAANDSYSGTAVGWQGIAGSRTIQFVR